MQIRVGLFQALHDNIGKCCYIGSQADLDQRPPSTSVLQVNCRKSQIPHRKNKCKIICLLGSDVERVQVLMFRKFPQHILEFRKCFKHLVQEPALLMNPGLVAS